MPSAHVFLNGAGKVTATVSAGFKMPLVGHGRLTATIKAQPKNIRLGGTGRLTAGAISGIAHFGSLPGTGRLTTTTKAILIAPLKGTGILTAATAAQYTELGKIKVKGLITVTTAQQFAVPVALSGHGALTAAAYGTTAPLPGTGGVTATTAQKLPVTAAFPGTFGDLDEFPLAFPFAFGGPSAGRLTAAIHLRFTNAASPAGTGRLTATVKAKLPGAVRGHGALVAGIYDVHRPLSGAGRLTATTAQRFAVTAGLPGTFGDLDEFPLIFPYAFGSPSAGRLTATIHQQSPLAASLPGVGALTTRPRPKLAGRLPGHGALTMVIRIKSPTAAPLRGSGRLTSIALAVSFTLAQALSGHGTLTANAVVQFPVGHDPIPINPDPELGPSIFMADYEFPPSGTVVVETLPRSEGGLIQSVKGAVVLAMRDALQTTSLFTSDQAVYIDLEYPMQQVQYPGIWIQFSVTKLNRSGIGHEVTVQDPATQVWSFIQEWTFLGRITLSILALKSIDRDRLSDAIVANIAFARTPNLLITKTQADTRQNRTLITALDENPYVAMTLNTDTIIPGGQTVTPGTPWNDDLLTYEDNWSFDLVGQFNLQFSHDGVYSLARIQPAFSTIGTQQLYNPTLWQDAVPSGPVGGGMRNPSGQMNPTNVNIPAF